LKNLKIIAEVGVNHNGKLSLAKKLIEHAKFAGADFVKFQCYSTNELVTSKAKKAKYQKKFDKSETQKQMLKKYELSEKDLKYLKNYCNKIGIKFLVSVFDIKSLNLSKKMGLKLIKIPSGELNNFELLEQIVKGKNEIILSTGMASFTEIGKTIKYLKQRLKRRLTVLHCISSYPTKPNQVQIKNMLEIKKKFNVNVGFSDHTDSYEASISATAFGASVIEKHLTLNKKMKGPDHSSSLDPAEFLNFVKLIRNTEKIIVSDKYKKITVDESKNSKLVRKSIVAKIKIKRGEKFSRKNITTKRPDNGISASKWFEVLNKVAKKDFNTNELIKL